ncbi:hypothetical protein OHA01_26205 [Micromonospora zamorensis]|uniref:hypothetical protein n=1 Tax=Micromonospora zamorensis TaxID=709883 RepID=UPI00386A0716|nr:hypothetical protein OHA01_26205 [Micromonospora zamorensis]
MSTTREELIAGLRALADFYEANPTMPVPVYPDLLVSCSNITPERDDEAAAELVRHAATLLGVEATQSTSGGWNVDGKFGSLKLSVYSTTQERMARYNAEVSYSGAVQPEDGTR